MIKKHWTPRYLANKLNVTIFEKMNQDKPWLTKDSIQYLDSKLNKDFSGLEFGSGRSTIWFAKKLGTLTSVEHNEEWYEIVKNKLKEEKIENVEYILKKKANVNSEENEHYSDVANNFDNESLDFVLVDGDTRAMCAILSIPKLKKGGMLVIDNINWYFPHKTHSPDSRGENGTCLNETWKKLHDQINNWETIWTTSGVTDTAIFIKP